MTALRDLGGRLGRTRPVPRIHFSRHRVVVGMVLLLALVFYVWTAGSTYPLTFLRTDLPYSTDVYNLMITGLLHGHAYLPLQIPPGLAHLSDPYNPVANDPYRVQFQDLLYHRHRLYSAWGPSTALLFAIVRVSGYRLSTSLADALYGFGGLLGAVALLHMLARRFVSGMPDWMLSVATVVLALTNVVPFALRRPAEYEAAINAALCFELLGLCLLASASLAPRPRPWRMAWGSLLLGLALLARPTMAVDLPLLLIIGFLLRGVSSRRTLALSLLGPFLACVVLLALYNVVRFGSAGNFGTRYQLAGIDVTHHPVEQLDYVFPGVFAYLFIPGQVSLVFPHFFLQTTAQLPFTVPSTYQGASPANGVPELTGGLLPTMPITLLLLWWPLAYLRRRPGERGALRLIGGGIVLTLAVMVLLSYALWGTTQRYEVDYASLALIAALLMWGLLYARRGPGWGRRGVVALGSLLALLGAAAGLAVSFTGYDNLLQTSHPHTFEDLQNATSPVVTAVAWLAGRPLLVGPGMLNLPTTAPYGQFDDDGGAVALGGPAVELMVDSPGQELAMIQANAAPSAVAPTGQVVIAATPRGTTTTRITGAAVRIPVPLKLGLNRVYLRLSGAGPTQLSQIVLTDLQPRS